MNPNALLTETVSDSLDAFRAADVDFQQIQGERLLVDLLKIGMPTVAGFRP
jgi:hypothetical protein